MTDVRTIARNFLAVGGSRLLLAGLSFGFYLYLQRRWDDTALGAFVTVQALFMVTLPLPLLGLNYPLVRDFAQARRPAPQLMASAAALGLIVAALGMLLFGLVGLLLYEDFVRPALWLVGASLIPGGLAVLAETRLTAQERLPIVARVSSLETLLRTGAWIALVVLGFGLTSLFVALLATRVVAALAYLRRDELRADLAPRLVDRATVRYLLTLCPVFLAMLLLNAGVARLDFLLLGSLSGLDEVGVYSRPYKIFELLLMVPTVLATVTFPAFARHVARGERPIAELLHPLLRMLLVVGLPLALLLGVLAGPLIALLFSQLSGAELERTTLALRWLSLAPVLVAVDQSMAMLLVASHRQDLDLRVLACACTLYAVLLLVLIPRYGCVGAAAATLIAAAGQVLIRYAVVRASLRTPGIAAVAGGPLAAGAISLGALLLVRPLSPLAAPFAAAVAFVAAIAVLRVVSRKDLAALRAALQSRRGVG